MDEEIYPELMAWVQHHPEDAPPLELCDLAVDIVMRNDVEFRHGATTRADWR